MDAQMLPALAHEPATEPAVSGLPADALPADRHPAAVYVASLAPGSRRTMRQALDTVAATLSGGQADAGALDWTALRYLTAHPGCARGSGGPLRASDGQQDARRAPRRSPRGVATRLHER